MIGATTPRMSRSVRRATLLAHGCFRSPEQQPYPNMIPATHAAFATGLYLGGSALFEYPAGPVGWGARQTPRGGVRVSAAARVRGRQMPA